MSISNMDNSSSSELRYQQALDWLFSRLPMFSRIGGAAYKPGLERVVALSEFFGNPHTKFPSIHIAGTNGKGSTSHMLASVLQAAGFKTALYTSPHLVDFRERIRINGKMIPKEEVVKFVEKWRNTHYDGDAPSFFELTMIMAFDWFAKEGVDIAVIETGMGGRLDSTNIITPPLSVITNISFDHTQFLGSTLPQIAAEKAGIIKPGIPVVIGEAEGDVESVFEEKATQTNSPLIKAYRLSDAYNFRSSPDSGGWMFDSSSFGPLYCDLAGDYQKKNINTVLAALSYLKDRLNISTDAVSNGLRNVESSTGLAGRWMILRHSPTLICDTGHNQAGLSYSMPRLESMLSEAIANAPEGGGPKLRMVIGFVADKDVEHILPLFPKNAEYYFTNAAIPRAMPVEDLLKLAGSHHLSGHPFATVEEAATQALADASPEDIIFIGGSTFVVADFLKSRSH